MRIHVDGRVHEVEGDGRNLLEVCLSLGYDLPYFCWHPAMDSVGACRQCAVKQFRDEDDTQGRIVMACMTGVEDDMYVSIDDDEARRFRAHVVEWLMVNHPHDCPVCDEGGECHLQDMTVMTGHSVRRHRFAKRTYANQDLGPLIRHEMNRCIQCYRCVRFYQDLAGGTDLQALAAHDHVYFGRHDDGTLESVFSGNLVEVCPTGVFTDKPLASHYTRKWDLRTAPSVCPHCSLGCNVTPGERHGELRRIRNRYHHDVNGYFLCDRGRYGYGFVDSDRRVREALAPRGEDTPAQRLDPADAVRRVAGFLDGDRPVAGIGSARASLESNLALRRLVGGERFHAGTEDVLHACARRAVELLRGPVRAASLADQREADAVLVLGEDLVNTAPLSALSLRRAAERRPREEAIASGIPVWHDAALREQMQDRHGPFHQLTPFGNELDAIATTARHAPPLQLARLGFAVAHALDDDEPAVDGLTDDERSLVGTIADDLVAAENPVVVSGASCAEPAVQEAAARIAYALGRRHERPAGLSLVQPEADSVGLALTGAKPLAALLDSMEAGEVGTLIVLESDLGRHVPADRLRRALEGLDHLVVVDHTAHGTGLRADVVLPAATWAESTGTFVSSEGRAQRFVQVFPPAGTTRASWRWFADVGRGLGRGDLDFTAVDDVLEAAGDLPHAEELHDLGAPVPADERVPRALHRYSGRTALAADRDVREFPPPADPDAPRSFSMEGFAPDAPAAATPEVWSPGWNSVQALNRFQEEVGGPLRGGETGRRILRPDDGGTPDPIRIPDASNDEDSTAGLIVLRRWRLFGSEELSAGSAPIEDRADVPTLDLASSDAERRGIEEGTEVEFGIDGARSTLRARIDPTLPTGTVALPVHAPDLPPPAAWPARLRIGPGGEGS
ncbi:MAG TPA: NADH-quinone oxidoreductase subunit NuoG [Candidatus Krumholzibacteria bacterium]|nr:NADH-quinone oxidoreductase subunit NuoG [Candidatus Krumholzibacteria bacterium]